MPKRSEVVKVLDEFNRHIKNMDASQIIEMTRRWMQVEKNLDNYVQLLSEQIAQRIKDGKSVTPNAIYQLDRYKDLLRQAVIEANAYQNYSERLIATNQAEYGRLGIDAAQSALRESYLQAGQSVARFNILPIEAVNNMIGNAGDGSPLFSVLKQRALAPAMVEGMRSTLIQAVANGDNPRTTANIIKNGLAQGLNKALVIARTEQIRVYRQASIDQYKASGVVDGFTRHCALDERTCLSCLALDGKQQSTDDLFEEHPNCRCFVTPNIEGLPPIEAQTGDDWLSKQSEEKQKEILGAHYDLYTNGTPIIDMVRIKDDPIWGPTIGIKPVGEFE
jgi:SPP1 gp7 family putative phage head morphogenesis protein